MDKINSDFFEEYKILDNLCKDMYLSREGVSKYIEKMESNFSRFRCNISEWNEVYQNLKHIRWIRNKLAHDSDFDNLGIVDVNDIVWIRMFYQSLLSGTDPLTKIANLERNSRVNLQMNNNVKIKQTQPQPKIQPKPHPQPQNQNVKANQKQSFLDRIFNKIKKLFNR